MAEDKILDKIKIDGKEYEIANLSDEAKAQLTNLKFVDDQIQQLNNELAISDTARIGYSSALKKELAKLKSK